MWTRVKATTLSLSPPLQSCSSVRQNPEGNQGSYSKLRCGITLPEPLFGLWISLGAARMENFIDGEQE